MIRSRRWRKIYGSDSLEAARAEQARTQADLNKIRMEDIQKKRIPIKFVEQIIL